MVVSVQPAASSAARASPGPSSPPFARASATPATTTTATPAAAAMAMSRRSVPLGGPGCFGFPCGRGLGGMVAERYRRPHPVRPTCELRSLALMTIGSLIIGLVGLAVGAAAVWFAVRDRLRASADAGARARALEQEMRGLERRAIEAEAQLDAERGTLDARVTNAVKAASAAAYAETQRAAGRARQGTVRDDGGTAQRVAQAHQSDGSRRPTVPAAPVLRRRDRQLTDLSDRTLDPAQRRCDRLTCAGAGGRCS